MSNYRRAYLPGGVYFFTVVTHDRAPIFTSEERVEILRESFRKIMAARPFRIDAMVILPDHLHCIWRMPEDDADYSSRWREIKKTASRRIAPDTDARNERAVWQRRFWEHVIRDEEDWRRHVDYIHYNPVKHRLAASPALWPWSSFGAAVNKGWYPESWGAIEPESIAGMDYEWVGGCAALIHPTGLFARIRRCDCERAGGCAALIHPTGLWYCGRAA